MQINKLHIQNYKCFEEVSMDLHPRFNLLVGGNGSGKTAVCEALAVALGHIIKVVDFDGSAFINDIKRKNVRTVTFDGQPKPQYPSSSYVDCNLWGEYFQQLGTYLKPKNGGVGSIVWRKSDNLFYEKLENSRKGVKIIFPLVTYYGTGRLWGWTDNTKVKKEEIPSFKQKEGVMLAYQDCLTPNSSNEAFISWYKTIDYEIQRLDQPHLTALRKVLNDGISSMVPDWEYIYFSPLDDDLVGVTNGEKRFFRQLSDGYRNTIGMVADMIYRCIQLNPHLGENVLKETPGVVLIDEIDLHLHPLWQSRVIADLQRIFPKVQFVATTHSPTVVANYANGALFVIGNDHSVRLCDEKYFGKEINEVLETVLGAPDRHKETQEKLDRLFQMIDEERPEGEFEELLTTLKTLLGLEDKEIQRAESLIAWNNFKRENPDAVHS